VEQLLRGRGSRVVTKKCTLNTHSDVSAVLEHLEHLPTTNGMQLF